MRRAVSELLHSLLTRWPVLQRLPGWQPALQVRWKDIEYFDEEWRTRVEDMAALVPPGASVVDLGCGEQWLRPLIGEERYTGVDYRARTADTIVCDFNQHEFPDIAADVAFVSGCLEYMDDPAWFIASICSRVSMCIMSYGLLESHPDLPARRQAGWVNDLTLEQLVGEFQSHSFYLSRQVRTASQQELFVFRRSSQIPKISVVLPFLNAKRFLAQAMESILAQTYHDWELVLVDDGSSDGGEEIAASYVRQYPNKVRCVCHAGHQNRGISASRNLGCHHARGMLIASLDADDVWLPQKLEQHVSILESHPEAGAVFGETLYWFSWGQDPRTAAWDFVGAPWKDHGVQPDTHVQPPALLDMLIRFQVNPCPCSLVVRRGVVERLGGWEDAFAGMLEDHAFYTKLFLGTPVFVASGCWERYRQHDESCVALAIKENRIMASRVFFWNWAQRYLRRQGCREPQIHRYLQNALMPYRHSLLASIQAIVYWLRSLARGRMAAHPSSITELARTQPATHQVEGVEPAYEGYLDTVGEDAIRGWAWNAAQPTCPIQVDAYCDADFVGTTRADLFREDLLAAGKGNGCHAFEFLVPFQLRNGKEYNIHVRVAGTEIELSGSPQTAKWPLQIVTDYQQLRARLGDRLLGGLKSFREFIARR